MIARTIRCSYSRNGRKGQFQIRRVPAAPEADEFMEIHEVRWSEVGRMIGRGEIRDGKTLVMVTHDLDSLHRVCDRIAVLGGGKIIEAGTMEAMLASKHPWLTSYFHGARAHADWHVRVKG